MPRRASPGRPNQRQRTRKDLLQAATRLTKKGMRPTLDEIAEEALVSRATVYRYFNNVDALLMEATLDVTIPDADTLLHDPGLTDPKDRLDLVDTTLHDAMIANEVPMRMMLAYSVQRRIGADAPKGLPTRQNRRSPLIEAALAPADDQFDPARLDLLRKALALIIGTEAMIVFKDVLQLSDRESRKVKRWAIHALVDAAVKTRKRT